MRQSKGKPGDLPLVKEFGDWSLYDAGDGKYKVCANVKVDGNANYTLTVEGGKILGRNDRSRLMAGRPEVYTEIETFFECGEENVGTSPDEDPYGDIAMNRNRKLNKAQNAKRLELYKRVHRIPVGDAVLQVLNEYFTGKYAPRSCETLSAQLDLIDGDVQTIDDLL